MGSIDGLYLTLVQYNDLLHITAWGDDPANGTDYYYGRISAAYSSNDEIAVDLERCLEQPLQRRPVRGLLPVARALPEQGGT